MKFLKIFGLVILSLFLFLSLLVFGLALTINQTALNPNFVVSQVDGLDIPSLAEDILSEQVPQEYDYMFELVVEAINDTIVEQEDEIKQQARDGIYVFYEYIKGEREHLSVAISMETVKESLRDNLWQAVLESPPPELAELPPAEIEQTFNQFWSEFSEEISSTLELDETSLDPEVMEQLEQAREYIGHFQLGFKLLIAFILLLILGIVLIYREVRGSTRQLGPIFLACGILSLAGFFITKSVADTQIAQSDIPAYLQTWLPQLVDDTLAPLGIYSIVLLVLGVAMLVVSFVYKRHKDEF